MQLEHFQTFRDHMRFLGQTGEGETQHSFGIQNPPGLNLQLFWWKILKEKMLIFDKKFHAMFSNSFRMTQT